MIRLTLLGLVLLAGLITVVVMGGPNGVVAHYDQWVGASMPPKVAAALLSPRSHSAPWFIVLLLTMFVVYIFLKTKTRRRTNKDKDDNRRLRIRRQPWHRRFILWRVHFFDQPYYWKIGKWVADLSQTHGLCVGGSGSGKSTLVVDLILQPVIGFKMWLMRRLGCWHRRPVVIISFDRSDPIEEATNVLEDQGVPVTRWRVRQSHGWDMLQGDIEPIAEALPDGWPHGDNTGFFQQLATDAIAAALSEQDEQGVERDFEDMIERMDRIMAEDPETPDLARRTWVRRFRSLKRVMGESIGSDFDLLDAMKPGAVVHLSSNSYTNPALTPLVGAMAITHIKLIADKVPGGAYLVLEEASFLKKRADMLDDLAKSMRARGWRIIYLNQNPQDVGEALQVNFGVAVFMGLGPLALKAREWCANIVKEFPGAFTAAELVLGATIDQLEGYVLLRGRCRDVSLAPYITRAAEHRQAQRARRWTMTERPGRGRPADLRPVVRVAGPVAGGDGSGGTEWWDGVNGTWLKELSDGTVEPKALGPGTKPTPPEYFVRSEILLGVWDGLTGTYDPMACWLIDKKKTNSEGRSKVWVPRGTRGWGKTVEEKGGYVTGYVMVCIARRGPAPAPDIDEDGKMKSWQVDHWCHTEDVHCPGGKECIHLRCMNGDHMQWVSPRQNTVRMRVRARRRKELLTGMRQTWETTVAEEADEWIQDRPLVVV
jgi:hypothetical protein